MYLAVCDKLLTTSDLCVVIFLFDFRLQVDIKNKDVRDKRETYEYDVTEEFPHLGKLTYAAKSTVDTELQRITTAYELLYGIVDGNMHTICLYFE